MYAHVHVYIHQRHVKCVPLIGKFFAHKIFVWKIFALINFHRFSAIDMTKIPRLIPNLDSDLGIRKTHAEPSKNGGNIYGKVFLTRGM